jgi:hypothetical protein
MYFSDGSAAQHKNRKKLSASTMNKILDSLLNGTALQQTMGRDQQMEWEGH